MSLLLRALLHRHRILCAPAGEEGGGGGGAAGAGEVDDADLDPDADGADEGDENGAAGDQGSGDAGTDDDPDAELVVSLGGADAVDEEDEDAIAAALAENNPGNAAFARMRVERKDLRRQTLDQAARIRQLEAERLAAQPEPAIVVGKEPDPDDYEMFEAEGKAKFKNDWAAWNQRKGAAETAQREQQTAAEAAQREWQQRLQAVEQAGVSLKVKGNTEAVEALSAIFSVAQMGMLVDAASDAKGAALMRYALGTNPAKARELAAIKHPVKFIAAVARLELNVKVTAKKSAPAPERRPRSDVTGAAAIEPAADRLVAEAGKTGDVTKLLALKREQRAKKAA